MPWEPGTPEITNRPGQFQNGAVRNLLVRGNACNFV